MNNGMHEVDLLDPNPEIHALLCHYNELYFGNALGACTVDWSSKRMTLCAGICHYTKMGGCAIRLSEPLLKFRSTTDLKNTLLHEMIHAYLFLSNGNKDHDDHGPCFQKMMTEINTSMLPDHQRPVSGYSITIYHNFIDEVNNYRTHHWKCQICGDLIKRAMNRRPSASDCMAKAACDELCHDTRCHWHQHQNTCSGEYIKIAEPPGYQDKRRHIKDCGKRDLDGEMKDGPILKKVGKSSFVTEENMKVASPNRTRSLESFYPKLENVNVSLDEHPVLDEKDNKEDSEEILIFKRRKHNSDECVKEGSGSMLMPKVEQRRKHNPEARRKAGKQDLDEEMKDGPILKKVGKNSFVTEENMKYASPNRTRSLESFYPKVEKVNVSLDEHLVLDEKDNKEDSEEILIFKRRKHNPDESVKECSGLMLMPKVEQRRKHYPEARRKAGPSSIPTPKIEQKLHKTVEGRHQQLEHVDGCGSVVYDFNVIIKWMDWYAFERDDEDIEPLINKRQERRRKEKMLKQVEIQNRGNLEVSVEAARWQKSCDNNDACILHAGRNDTKESHLHRSLSETNIPRIGTSGTGTVGSNSFLVSASKNFEHSHLCNSGLRQSSLPCLDSNRTEACLKRQESNIQHTNSEKMGFEHPLQRNITTSDMMVDASCNSARAAKFSYFGSTGTIREKIGTSNMVEKKEMPHKVLDLELKDRVNADLIELDDTAVDAISLRVQSIGHETGLSSRHLCSKFYGTCKGDCLALEKRNSCFEISEGESEENCSENTDFRNGLRKERVRTFLYLNGQSKREQEESRQGQVVKPRDGISAPCPICGKVLEGDIGEENFNQRFNAHLDRCIGSST